MSLAAGGPSESSPQGSDVHRWTALGRVGDLAQCSVGHLQPVPATAPRRLTRHRMDAAQ